MPTQFRAWLRPVHRWTGLTLGLLLVFLAGTGGALEFRGQLHRLAEPAALRLAPCGRPLPLDDQLAAARAAHATGSYETVVLGESGSGPTLVRFTDDTAVYVDGCSGRVVAQQARWGGLFGRLEQLHRFRFLADHDLANACTGGAAALLALWLVAGGVALWWPARGTSLAAAARLRPHLKGRALELNVHRVCGLWGSVLLLGVALTALPLAFPAVRTAIDAVVGSPPPARQPRVAPPAPVARPLAMGVLWQRAQAVLDHPTRAVLAFPNKADRAVEIYALEADAPHAEARSFVYLDPYGGAILRVEPYRASPLGNRIYRGAAAIHAGEYGLALQLLEFVGTLALPVLAWTGGASWLRSRRRAPPPPDEPALVLKVVRVRDEAVDIRSYELAAADGGMLPRWEAGAHIDVEIAPGLMRPYSLCGDPGRRGSWRIAVKRTFDSRGGSRALHDRFQVGTACLARGPRNQFPLAAARHHVLLAAGIGITPLLAMARQLQARRASFELHYFVHGPGHAAFVAELAQPQFAGKVHVRAGLDRGTQRELLRRLLREPGPGRHLYACGPAGFLEGVRAAAAAWPADHVHSESFRADAAALAGPRPASDVELRRSGRRLTVPADRSIAEALAEHGAPARPT